LRSYRGRCFEPASASLGVHVLANALDKAILQLEDEAVVIVVVSAVGQRGLHAFLDDDGIAVGVESAEANRHVGDEHAAESLAGPPAG
jgi:hypothetical protein